jgi:hypothetical protein
MTFSMRRVFAFLFAIVRCRSSVVVLSWGSFVSCSAMLSLVACTCCMLSSVTAVMAFFIVAHYIYKVYRSYEKTSQYQYKPEC